MSSSTAISLDIRRFSSSNLFAFTASIECTRCHRVAAPQTTWKKCSRCRRARYCSPECQLADWRGANAHRKHCKPLPAEHADELAGFARQAETAILMFAKNPQTQEMIGRAKRRLLTLGVVNGLSLSVSVYERPGGPWNSNDDDVISVHVLNTGDFLVMIEFHLDTLRAQVDPTLSRGRGLL